MTKKQREKMIRVFAILAIAGMVIGSLISMVSLF